MNACMRVSYACMYAYMHGWMDVYYYAAYMYMSCVFICVYVHARVYVYVCTLLRAGMYTPQTAPASCQETLVVV